MNVLEEVTIKRGHTRLFCEWKCPCTCFNRVEFTDFGSTLKLYDNGKLKCEGCGKSSRVLRDMTKINTYPEDDIKWRWSGREIEW